jgi:hypothetical protein
MVETADARERRKKREARRKEGGGWEASRPKKSTQVEKSAPTRVRKQAVGRPSATGSRQRRGLGVGRGQAAAGTRRKSTGSMVRPKKKAVAQSKAGRQATVRKHKATNAGVRKTSYAGRTRGGRGFARRT